MTCSRCDVAPATGTHRARLRRSAGRGHVLTLPVRLCDGCAATVARLLAPATLVREGGL